MEDPIFHVRSNIVLSCPGCVLEHGGTCWCLSLVFTAFTPDLFYCDVLGSNFTLIYRSAKLILHLQSRPARPGLGAPCQLWARFPTPGGLLTPLLDREEREERRLYLYINIRNWKYPPTSQTNRAVKTGELSWLVRE